MLVNLLHGMPQVDMSHHYPLTPPSSNEDSPQPPEGYYDPSINFTSSESIYDTHSYAHYPSDQPEPCIKILEQPIDKFRFRYKSEMTGTHGSLCGTNSDKSRKQTYPTIELCNYNKPALIRCQIYQVNAHYADMPHAHRLVRKQGKDEVDDPHDAIIDQGTGFIHSFNNMGIIHTAKKYIVPELIRKKTKLKREEIARYEGKIRNLNQNEEMQIKGLAEDESKSINLNVVCLRFDAFEMCNGILNPICPPVYSHGINNLKSALTGELKIVRMDHVSCSVKGNKEIFMLVERVTKKNIKIRFYELDDEDNVMWEDYGRFSDLDVHHQYAIVFKTPPYKDVNITSPVRVFIELERPSDKQRSEPKEFRYVPTSDSYKPGSKRPKWSDGSSSINSSLASDELPVTVSNLFLGNPMNFADNPLGSVDLEVNSEDLQTALNDIDSEDLDRLFQKNKFEYIEAQSGDSCMLDGRPMGQMDTTPYFVSQLPQIGCRSICKMLTGSSIEPKKLVFLRNVDDANVRMAENVLEELKNFIKTHPTTDKTLGMIKHYFSVPNKTNALHVFIKQNNVEAVVFILKLLHVWKQTHCLNLKNEESETPLHIATYCRNESIINSLIHCKADVSIGDYMNNTALHMAVISNVPTTILEKLLSVDNLAAFIDAENNDGNTALNIAIDKNDMRTVKLLCLRGADVNKLHKKSGYTALRFAIEKLNIEMVQYLLQHNNIEPLVEDFKGISPLHAAMKKDNPELLAVITHFMETNGYCTADVKDEDVSDEEDEEKVGVKVEQVSAQELREMYANVKEFTTDCLDQVAQLLDESGTWENLVDLLDLGHLRRAGLFNTQNSSPSKAVLKAALDTNGDTMLEIRDFLENLDEIEVVKIIDNMVISRFQ